MVPKTGFEPVYPWLWAMWVTNTLLGYTQEQISYNYSCIKELRDFYSATIAVVKA